MYRSQVQFDETIWLVTAHLYGWWNPFRKRGGSSPLLRLECVYVNSVLRKLRMTKVGLIIVYSSANKVLILSESLDPMLV